MTFQNGIIFTEELSLNDLFNKLRENLKSYENDNETFEFNQDKICICNLRKVKTPVWREKASLKFPRKIVKNTLYYRILIYK